MNITLLLSGYKSRTNLACFILAVSLHLFFLATVVIIFKTPPIREPREITFLGAILDQFEVEKMSSEEFSSQSKISAVPLANDNAKNRTRRVTSLEKPVLIRELRSESKSVQKLPAAPQIDNNISQPSIKTSNKTSEFPELKYQPLKLPR